MDTMVSIQNQRALAWKEVAKDVQCRHLPGVRSFINLMNKLQELEGDERVIQREVAKASAYTQNAQFGLITKPAITTLQQTTSAVKLPTKSPTKTSLAKAERQAKLQEGINRLLAELGKAPTSEANTQQKTDVQPPAPGPQ